MKDWSFGLKEIFPQKPKAKNSVFKIQSYQRMTFAQHGGVAVCGSYFGAYEPFSFRKRHTDISFNVSLQPVATVKLSSAKENDIRSLFRFLTEEEVAWFDEILSKGNQLNMTEEAREGNSSNEENC